MKWPQSPLPAPHTTPPLFASVAWKPMRRGVLSCWSISTRGAAPASCSCGPRSGRGSGPTSLRNYNCCCCSDKGDALAGGSKIGEKEWMLYNSISTPLSEHLPRKYRNACICFHTVTHTLGGCTSTQRANSVWHNIDCHLFLVNLHCQYPCGKVHNL